MTIVAQVLKSKPETTVYTISPEATVLEAISLMANTGVGALVVTEHDRVVGMLSERDYTRKIALMERSSYNTSVSEIMTSTVYTISMNHSVEDCLELMTERHIRHLPIMENDKLIGLISIGDLVKSVIDAQKKHIDQLHQYISGGQ